MVELFRRHKSSLWKAKKTNNSREAPDHIKESKKSTSEGSKASKGSFQVSVGFQAGSEGQANSLGKMYVIKAPDVEIVLTDPAKIPEYLEGLETQQLRRAGLVGHFVPRQNQETHHLNDFFNDPDAKELFQFMEDNMPRDEWQKMNASIPDCVRFPYSHSTSTAVTFTITETDDGEVHIIWHVDIKVRPRVCARSITRFKADTCPLLVLSRTRRTLWASR